MLAHPTPATWGDWPFHRTDRRRSSPDSVSQEFTEASPLVGYRGPASVLGEVETDEVTILINQLLCLLLIADSSPSRASSSWKTSDRRFRKTRGRM